MKIKLFCFFTCILFGNTDFVFSQNIDSLKSTLAKAKEDTNKVNTLLKLCSHYGFIDNATRIKYSDNALQLSTQLEYRKGIINSKIILGGSFSELGEYGKALAHLNNALKICQENLNDKFTLAKIYNEIGGVYYYQSDYALAMPYYIKSLAIFEELQDKKRMANVATNIAWIYYQIHESKMALQYSNMAMLIRQQLKDTIRIAGLATQMGDIYVQLKEYDLALSYFERSLAITDKLQDKSSSLQNLMGIGDILRETKKHGQSLIYFKRALILATKEEDQQNIAHCMMSIGNAYAYTGKFKEGVTLLKQAADLARKIGAKRLTADAYFYLSEIFEKENNAKEALKYSRLFTGLNDSVFNEESAKQIHELSAKYESEKKEKEIALLNVELVTTQKDQEILNTKIDEKNRLIIATIISGLLLTISILLFFNRRQLTQKNIHQAEINKQQENTAIAIIQAQESERNRIAQDMHDGIGTYISTLKINLQSFEASIPAEKKDRFKITSALVDKTAAEIRNIMKNLSSETLQEAGLVGALSALVESINNSGITRLDFISKGLVTRPDAIIELNLYRSAQELINNCVKHAHATKTTLQLIDHEDTVLLMIEDNGNGFDTERDGHGMGLKNIRNRISFIKGTVKVESVLGKGSTFIIETPKHLL